MKKSFLLKAATVVVAALLALAAWKARSSARRRAAEADMSAAERSVRRKDFSQAERLLSPLLSDLGPEKRYRALCMRAEARAWLKKPAQAREDLETARSIDGEAWDAHYGLARLALLDVQNNCSSGLKLLETALAKKREAYWTKARELTDIHRLSWRCHQQLGDVESALASLSRELAARYEGGETTGENVHFALLNRAWANYMLYEKYMARLASEGWENIYQERFGRDPSRGTMEGGTEPRKLAEAVPYQFLAAAEFDASTALGMKEDVEARLLHTRVLVAAGKGPQARQDLAALAAMNGIESNPEYWLLKASAEGQRKDYPRALASVERSLQLDPENREALQLREMILHLSPKRGKSGKKR